MREKVHMDPRAEKHNSKRVLCGNFGPTGGYPPHRRTKFSSRDLFLKGNTNPPHRSLQILACHGLPWHALACHGMSSIPSVCCLVSCCFCNHCSEAGGFREPALTQSSIPALWQSQHSYQKPLGREKISEHFALSLATRKTCGRFTSHGMCRSIGNSSLQRNSNVIATD